MHKSSEFTLELQGYGDLEAERYDQGEKEAPALVAAGFCTKPLQ
jgi:hypothetical protein